MGMRLQRNFVKQAVYKSIEKTPEQIMLGKSFADVGLN